MAEQLQKDIRGMRYDEKGRTSQDPTSCFSPQRCGCAPESLADGVGDRMLVGCSRGDS
jgi:hypothetical protein